MGEWVSKAAPALPKPNNKLPEGSYDSWATSFDEFAALHQGAPKAPLERRGFAFVTWT